MGALVMINNKILIHAVICGFLSACTPFTNTNSHNPMSATPYLGQHKDTMFAEGLRAGCDSGIAAKGNYMLRTQYQLNINPQMMNNRSYRRGWDVGHSYCMQYVKGQLNIGIFDRDMGDGVFGSEGQVSRWNDKQVEG